VCRTEARKREDQGEVRLITGAMAEITWGGENRREVLRIKDRSIRTVTVMKIGGKGLIEQWQSAPEWKKPVPAV